MPRIARILTGSPRSGVYFPIRFRHCEFDWLALTSRISSASDTLPKPRLYFSFDPADCTGTNPHSAWELAFGLKLVNHRAAEPGGAADIRQAENLDCAVTFGGHGVHQHP